MMKRIILFTFLINCIFTPSFSQEADSLIANHLISWGQEQLLSIRTVQFDVMEVKGAFNRTKYQITRKRPNKIRLDEVWEDKPVVSCFDGKAYWADVPWHISDEPYQVLNTEKLKLDNSMDMDSPLFVAKNDGLNIEYLDVKMSDETPYHVLRVNKSEKRYLDFYIDMETYHIFKTVERDQGNLKYVYEETFFKSYRPQAGINIPMEYEIRGRENTRNIVINEITLGHGVPNSFFQNPK